MKSAHRLLCFSFLLTGACASRAPSTPVRPPLLSVAEGAADYSSPARWRYHPRQAAPMLARESWRGATLFAGERGERWRVDKRAEASAHLGPETLVAILHPDPSRWVYLGASGTAYEAEGPLGPFLRGIAPLDPLARVRAAAATLLGLRMNGELVRSTDTGLSWTAVGPPGTRFSDFALLRNGTALALAVPERLWSTRDFGQRWTPVDTKPIGALSLAEDSEDAITVQGVLGNLRYPAPAGDASAGGTVAPALGPTRRGPESLRFKLGVELGRGPNAGALAEGRAVVSAGRYYEFERGREDSTWRLWRGRVEGALQPIPAVVANHCHTTRVAGFRDRLVMACWRQSPTSSAQPMELFNSEDRGRSWRPISVTVWGRLSDFELAIGRDGALIATGVCASRDSAPGCRPQGVHYLRPARPSAPRVDGPAARNSAARKLEFLPAATPAAGGVAEAVTFSTDGNIAYVLAPRRQGRSYALYVSRDRGRSFVPHEIGALRDQSSPGDEDEFEGGVRRRAGPVVALVPAEDGSLALITRQGDAMRLLVADQDGQLISTADPPTGATGLGAAGVRALAFSAATGRVWESLDGGTAWDEMGRLPLPLCRGDSDCRVPVVCHPGGCVIGDDLSRVGWKGQADSAPALPPPPGKRPLALVERKVATPLVCALAAEPWKHVDGAETIPRAEQAALGKVAWFAAVFDENQGAFAVVHGFGGPKPRLERVTLLPPVTGQSGYARHLSLQVEGVAALRYRVPKAQDPRLIDVEVGWENLLEGRARRARIGDGGSYRPGDYETGPGGEKLALPNLVSIADGGLYLRLHSGSLSSQETLFLDGVGMVRIPAVGWPSVPGGASGTEVVHVDGQHVPLLFVGGGAALVRARPQGSGWVFDALTVGLGEPSKFGLAQGRDIAYLGARAGLQITTRDIARTRYRAQFFAFRASGALLDPPLEAPAQLDAGDRPRPCTAQERSSTPRVVMPHQAGSRHPILITDGTDPQRVFLSSDAVMHGTPQEACMAAFEANQIEPIAGAEGQLESALVALDDLEHAWLFRMAPTDPKGTPGFDYRLMSCRFDSSVEIPNVVYEAPGTLIPR